MQVSLPLWASPSDLHAAPWPCDWDEEGSQRGRQPALGGACPGLTATPTPPLSPQVFSIVVFGSIVNEGYLNSPLESEEFCIYNRNPNACGYGVTVGVLAFLTCLLYLALDVYFPQISSVKDRKKAVLSDIGVSGEPHPSGYCAPLPPPAAQSARGFPDCGPAQPHTHLGGGCHPSAHFPDGETEVQAVAKGQTWGHKAGSRVV